MKKALFVAFVACLTMVFSSCSKDKHLNGTKWQGSYDTSITEQGITMDAHLTMTINFTNATEGDITTSGNVTYAGISFPVEDHTYPMTYTFDGEAGTITAEGETEPFTYNKKDNTINFTFSDEELGNVTFVLNEVK